MQNFLRDPIRVALDALFLDPNNPRLARDEMPGYDDAKALFDPDTQTALQQRVDDFYNVKELMQTIVTQGWMPIDNIVVWEPPHTRGRYIVVEGNTRREALRRIRVQYAKEQEKLARMKRSGRRQSYAQHDIEAQEALVRQFERLIADTETLTVVPIDADTVEELEAKLPRVLAVRHITGAKPWDNYAEDLWLLARYDMLFKSKHPGESLRLDLVLIRQIADEASISDVAAKRSLLAASCFSHFKAEYEDQLPKGEAFAPSDYYLFENIVKKPFVRTQLGLTDDPAMLHIPEQGEEALFNWVFVKPRGKTADDNPNVFFRHENILVWDEMRRHDEKNGTSFASRFDVEDWQNAPTMKEVYAEFVSHKLHRKPTDIIEQLLRALDQLDLATLAAEGPFLRNLLSKVHEKTAEVLRVVNALKKK